MFNIQPKAHIHILYTGTHPDRLVQLCKLKCTHTALEIDFTNIRCAHDGVHFDFSALRITVSESLNKKKWGNIVGIIQTSTSTSTGK